MRFAPFILAFVVWTFSIPAMAQSDSDCLTVGYHQFPGVIEDGFRDGEYSGLAYDIVRKVGSELGRKICLVEFPIFGDIFPDREPDWVSDVEIMIGAFTVKAEREAHIDFTHSYMNSGVGILVPADGNGFSFVDLLKELMNTVTLSAFAFLIAVIVVGGFILWLLERNDDRGIRNSVEGIWDGIQCAEDSVTTDGFGRVEPRTWLGRIFILILFFIGTVPMSTIGGQIASALTVAELSNGVDSPDKLRGRTVATKAGTSNVEILERIGATTVTVPTREDAVALLQSGDVEAVVYDAPFLQRVAVEDESVTVSATFAPQHYGFAMPQGSALREPVNAILLRMWASGEIPQLTTRYFGSE